MKTILTSVLVGSLLTTLALAQQPSHGFGRRELVHNLERRTSQTANPATPNLMAYAINIAFEFGAVDLRSGAFLPIGPGLPSDVGDGLVQGHGRSLLSLGFDGNLVAIDPVTGLTSVVCRSDGIRRLFDPDLAVRTQLGQLDRSFQRTLLRNRFRQQLVFPQPPNGCH